MSGAPSQTDLWDYKPKMEAMYNKELPQSIRKGQRLTTMTSGQASFPIFGYWSSPNISICGGRCWKSTPPSTYSFEPVM